MPQLLYRDNEVAFLTIDSGQGMIENTMRSLCLGNLWCHRQSYPLVVITYSVKLQIDEEVEALYDITASKAIYIQVIRYRDPSANLVVPDSPLSDVESCFCKDFLRAPTY